MINMGAKEKLKKYEEILKDPNLLENILQEIGKRVVGEQDTIKAILINACGIWVENYQIASYNLHLNDQPGLGKDYIMKATLEIFPQNNVVYRTKLTPQVLAYWHQDEPTWTWNDKILYIEDISNDLLQSDVFKTMASTGSNATVLIKQKPVDIKINGKPVIMITSYKTHPNDENLRRFPILGCDETAEQTLKIMQKQAQDATTGIETVYDDDIKQALHLLTPWKVRIPYGVTLPSIFPRNRYMRTHFHRFLDLINASAVLHQFQRKKDDGYLLATMDDYKIARDVLLKMTSNTEMIPLTRIQKEILSFIRKHNGNHSVPNMAKNLPYTDKTLRLNSDKLVSHGLLKRDTEIIEDSKKPVRVYLCNKPELELELPSEITILSKVSKVVDLKSTNKENRILGGNKDNNIGIIDKINNNDIIDKINNNDIIDKINNFNNFDTFSIPLKKLGLNEGQISLLSKVFGVMVVHLSNELFIGELGDATGIPPAQVKNALIELTSNPNNPTPIRMKDERGDSYILSKSELERWRNNGGKRNRYEGHTVT